MDKWQLQHRRSLAFDEQRHQDIASIGKFDHVVMAMRHIWFDHTKLAGAAMTRISISNAALEGIEIGSARVFDWSIFKLMVAMHDVAAIMTALIIPVVEFPK